MEKISVEATFPKEKGERSYNDKLYSSLDN